LRGRARRARRVEGLGRAARCRRAARRARRRNALLSRQAEGAFGARGVVRRGSRGAGHRGPCRDRGLTAMLKALSDLLERVLGAGDGARQAAPDRQHGIRLATALLLVEVERADFDENITEREETLRLLREHFELSDEEAALLVEEASRTADHVGSLQAFTRRLHEALTYEEKQAIVEMLWKVALADSHLDKHEDHLVRKIADLLYVSHGDLIRIRNRVKDALGS